jgi:Divergent InlB B-repeat domain
LSSSNTVNSGVVHGVALMQADGLNQLRTPGLRNSGDSGDPYPGSTGNVQLSWQTNPPAAANNGEYAGFMIDRILQATPQGSMSFRFTRRARSLIMTTAPDVTLRVNGRNTARFEDVLVPGDQVSVEAPDTVTTGDSRTRYHFSNWSNGQPASFALAPRAEMPETLTATYALQHRIRVKLTGTGEVESSALGVVGEGSFVPADRRLKLTATPVAGASFLGWSGDTTAATAVLELAAQRPYDLTAEFSVSLAVLPVVNAVNALLGGAPLAGEIANGLDGAGNRNGSYDVGDLLAYLDRIDAELDPVVVQQLLGSRP